SAALHHRLSRRQPRALSFRPSCSSTIYIRREEIFANNARRSSTRPAALVFGRYIVFAVAAGMYFWFRAHAVMAPSNIWVGFVGVTGGQRILTASRVSMEYLLLLFFPSTCRRSTGRKRRRSRGRRRAVLLKPGLSDAHSNLGRL